VDLNLLGMPATIDLLQPRVKDDNECGAVVWNEYWQGKQKYMKKTSTRATFILKGSDDGV
jgi:hypothetical protein